MSWLLDAVAPDERAAAAAVLHGGNEICIDDFQADPIPDAPLPADAAVWDVREVEARLLPRRPLPDAGRRREPLRPVLRVHLYARQKANLAHYLRSL